jgi:hypothetical protein
MSDANRVQIGYVEENAFGEFPSPAEALQILRLTSDGLKQDTSTVQSNEMRSDRRVADIIRTGISAVGDIGFEFSYGAYDYLLRAAMLAAAWSSPVTDISSDTTISVDTTELCFQSTVNDAFDNYAEDEWILVEGFTSTGAANNGLHKIQTIGDQTPGTLDSNRIYTYDTLTATAAGDSVSITQGGSIFEGTTVASIAFEKEFKDLSNTFHQFNGCMVNTFNLSVAIESLLSGSFNVLGKRMTTASATGGDGSPTAAPTNDVMNSIDNVVAVINNNASYASTGFDFNLNNNLRTRLQIGTLGAISIGTGSFNGAGSLNAYFTSSTQIDYYVDFTETSLALQLMDNNSNYYVFEFPAVKFTDGAVLAEGINTDVMCNMSFELKMDSSEEKMIKVARFPSS